MIATTRCKGGREQVREYLIEAREKAGLTQQDVANRIGISRQYYQMVETGERQKRIKKIQDKIPDAVQNDLEAQGKAAPAEKKEKPPVGETVGFRMARQFAETEPGFKDFIVALANKLQNG